jgi:hypothetical protein
MLFVGAHHIEGFGGHCLAGYLVCLHTQVSYPTDAEAPPAFTTQTGRESENQAPKYRENITGINRGALQ